MSFRDCFTSPNLIIRNNLWKGIIWLNLTDLGTIQMLIFNWIDPFFITFWSWIELLHGLSTDWTWIEHGLITYSSSLLFHPRPFVMIRVYWEKKRTKSVSLWDYFWKIDSLLQGRAIYSRELVMDHGSPIKDATKMELLYTELSYRQPIGSPWDSFPFKSTSKDTLLCYSPGIVPYRILSALLVNMVYWTRCPTLQRTVPELHKILFPSLNTTILSPGGLKGITHLT